MSDTFELTPSESVIVRRSEPALLEVEGVWGPNGDPPPKHFHPDQDEHFRVLAGALRAQVDGVVHDLGQGDTLEIPRGSVHQMWNTGDVEARAAWQTRPAGRTEHWFRSVHEVNRRGRPGPLAFGALLSEYGDVFRLAVGPQLLMRPLVGVLGALGRARGHRPVAG